LGDKKQFIVPNEQVDSDWSNNFRWCLIKVTMRNTNNMN